MSSQNFIRMEYMSDVYAADDPLTDDDAPEVSSQAIVPYPISTATDDSALCVGDIHEDKDNRPDDSALSVDDIREDKENQRCPGCAAVRHVDADFIEDEEKVVWDPRSIWCKKCKTVHRTVYSATQSLTLFVDYINSAENRDEWISNLMAYLCLLHEGNKNKITAPMIRTRVHSNRYQQLLLGMPCKKSTVIPYSDFVDNRLLWGRLADHEVVLTTITTNGKSEIGVYVPEPPMKPSMTLVTQTKQLLGIHRFLRVDDGTIYKDNAGEPTSAFASFTAPAASLAIVPAGSAGTKLDGKFWAYQAAARGCLMPLGSRDWQKEMKESYLRDPIKKIAGLMLEACHLGIESMEAKIARIANGLHAGKNFLRVYREYVKSKHKHCRLADLSVFLDPLIAYMKEENIVVAHSLLLLQFQGRFFTKLEKNDHRYKYLAPVIEYLCVENLDAVLAANVEEEKQALPGAKESDMFSPALWFRSMLLKGFEIVVGSWKITETITEDLELWAVDLQKMLEFLKRFGSVGVEGLAVLQLDAGTLLAPLNACLSAQDCDPKALTKAMSHLNSTKMKPVQVALQSQKDVYEKLRAAVAVVLTRSTQDDLGDNKATSAVNILSLPAMPFDRMQTKLDVDYRHMGNAELVVNMQVSGVLQESFSGIKECLALWSALRLSEMQDELSNWVVLFTREVVTADAILCCLQATAGKMDMVRDAIHSGFQREHS